MHYVMHCVMHYQVASIDEEIAAGLPQLGLGGAAVRGFGLDGSGQLGLARAAAALLPASDDLDDGQVVT